jgi:hypothetical protein
MRDRPGVTMAGQGHNFGCLYSMRSAYLNHNFSVLDPTIAENDSPRELPDSSCRVNAKSAMMIADLRDCFQSQTGNMDQGSLERMLKMMRQGLRRM